MEMAASGELQQLLNEQLGTPPPAAAAAAVPAAAAAAANGGGGLDAGVRRRLEGLVRERPVMVFIKGTPDAPRWGVGCLLGGGVLARATQWE